MKAHDLFDSAPAIRVEIDDKKGIAYTCANISNVYGQMSHYKQALEHQKDIIDSILCQTNSAIVVANRKLYR